MAKRAQFIPAHYSRLTLKEFSSEQLYTPNTTAARSLEFLGEQASVDGLRAAQLPNGSIGNSPAATAFLLTKADSEPALDYLRERQAESGGTLAPVLHPCETFELLWSAYHLFLAGRFTTSRPHE